MSSTAAPRATSRAPSTASGTALAPDTTDRDVRPAAVTAGATIIALAVLAAFGALLAIEGLVTDGDAARTATDIRASEGLFRAGVASVFVVAVLDVVVALALYRVLAPVSRGMSAVAAAFRLVYAGVLLVAAAHLLGAVRLLDGATPDGDARALLAIESFQDTWLLGLGLFGAHLAVVGVLAYRSGYVPRILGVLLVVAGAGYAADTFGRIASDSWGEVSGITFVGEFAFAVWLLVRGRRIVTDARPAVIDVTA